MIKFLSIDTITPAPSGAVTITAFGPNAGSSETVDLASRAVAEMMATEPVGDVIALHNLRDGLFLRAQISAGSAVTKIRATVYRGIALVIDRAGRVERVALVDYPDALGKRAENGAAAPLRLNLSGATTMSPMQNFDRAYQRALAAPPSDRLRVLVDQLAKGAYAPPASPIGVPAGALPIINAAEVAEIIRAERDRDEHRQRLAKREAKPADNFERPIDRAGALDLIKRHLASPGSRIAPGFAFGYRE